MDLYISDIRFDEKPKRHTLSSGSFKVHFTEVEWDLPLFRFKVTKRKKVSVEPPDGVRFFKEYNGVEPTIEKMRNKIIQQTSKEQLFPCRRR